MQGRGQERGSSCVARKHEARSETHTSGHGTAERAGRGKTVHRQVGPVANVVVLLWTWMQAEDEEVSGEVRTQPV